MRRGGLAPAAALLVGSLTLVGCGPGGPFGHAGPSVASAPPSIERTASGGDPFGLRRAPADLACDAIGVSYGRARIIIDGNAPDPVTAETDDGHMLHTYWSEGFSLGLAPNAVADWEIRDPFGVKVAGVGEVLDIPDGAWPRLHGYFVCPTADALYVLSKDPI